MKQVLTRVDGYWTRSGRLLLLGRRHHLHRRAVRRCRLPRHRHDLPGERAGRGNAVGEFGLAYVIAHEYAHNVQFELGFYQLLRPEDGVKAFELQADCMVGL